MEFELFIAYILLKIIQKLQLHKYKKLIQENVLTHPI